MVMVASSFPCFVTRFPVNSRVTAVHWSKFRGLVRRNMVLCGDQILLLIQIVPIITRCSVHSLLCDAGLRKQEISLALPWRGNHVVNKATLKNGGEYISMIHLTVRKHETKSKAIKIHVHSQRDIRTTHWYDTWCTQLKMLCFAVFSENCKGDSYFVLTHIGVSLYHRHSFRKWPFIFSAPSNF